MRISRWQDTPQTVSLDAKQLHLWRIALTVPPATLQLLTSWLSPDETSRAERLLDRNKATEFVVARAGLRQILGRYLNMQPAELTFRYGSAGKPQLHEVLNSSLTFNLSHSGKWALLAIAAGTEVGVDLERVDPHIDCRAVAESYFTPNEKTLFNRLNEPRQRRGFYRIWTGKEARLKRAGHGFSKNPEAETPPSAEQTRFFPVGRDYLGAVSTTGAINSIRRYQLLNFVQR